LEDAKFLRLRNISISYRIPKSVLKFADLRISAGAENLFIRTKYTGLDPETYNTQMDPNNTAYMADTHGGQDLGSFPLPRIITFGLRFDF
jgi:outer membrane receptor protein involved in Fe transport